MRSPDSATTRLDDYIVDMLPWAHGHQRKGSCTGPLRIIISPPKPGTIPQLNPFWRGHGHGATPVVLPTRSVGSPLALRHVASQLAQAKRAPASPASHAPQAQAQAL